MEYDLRFALFVAFAGLLILLRFDAARFGAAEYDDEQAPGGWRNGLRRLAWVALGIVLAVAIHRIHLQPTSVLHLAVGTSRVTAVTLGVAFALVGTVLAFASAWYLYRTARWPALRYYPGAVVNSLGTAFIDEVAFRGALLGIVLAFRWPAELAVGFQALCYVVITGRRGAWRSYGLLGMSLFVGLVAGALTVVTGGIAAGFLGHAVTRFAVFLATGHAGLIRPSSWDDEGPGSAPVGWEVVGETERPPMRP